MEKPTPNAGMEKLAKRLAGLALDAAMRLEKADPEAVEAVADLIAESAVPFETAHKIVANVARWRKREQRAFARLYRSDDPEDVSLAKSRAVKAPPAPPARLSWLRDAIRKVESAQDDRHEAASAKLETAHSALRDALAESEADYQELRKREGWG